MSSQPRILVVDDNRSLVHIVARLLQREGFEVLTAFDGAQGLKKARRERPDLIILDIIMPGMDGYQVSRRLQAHADTAAIPVLMFTVLGQTEVDPVDDPGRYNVRVHQRLEGFESGALEFLSKPIKAKELLKRVKALLWTRGVL